MDWKTIGIILFISIVFVYYLYRIKKLQQRPNSIYNKKVTKFGYVIFTIMIVVMAGILSLEHTAPNSQIGKLVSTNEGSLLVMFVVAIVFAVIGHFLRKVGLKELDNNKKDARVIMGSGL